MVAVEFNPVYNTLVVLLSSLIPGIAIGWPFLCKSKLSLLERLLLCFFIGLVLVPALMFLEFYAGIKFSLFLVLANIFALTAAGILWGIKNGAFAFTLPKFEFDGIFSPEFAKTHAVSALLLIAILLSFWIRLQSYSPIYSELDPYYYIYGTGEIIRLGAVPPTDDLAWWPELSTSHRASPLTMYVEAEWYSIYTGGGAYNNYLIFLTSCWLPPIASGLVTFGAYLLFASYYKSRRYGIFAAFLMAFLPITIFKMSAGVNEVLDYGLMTMFIMLGTYALALKQKDIRLAIISSLAFGATVLGSNYMQVAALAFSGFVFLQSIDYYLRGKRNEHFVAFSLCLAAGGMLGLLLESIYSGSATILSTLTSGTSLMILVAAAACFAGDRLVAHNFKEKRRMGLFAAACLVGLMLLLATPIGAIVKGHVGDLVSFVGYNVAVYRTIAEQNDAGSNFESEGGFIALVPSNHAAQGLEGALYGGLQLLAVPFTAVANGAMQLADNVFNLFLGTNVTSSAKDGSLLFAFMIIGTVGLVYRHFARKDDERDLPSLALFILLFILPTSYVGLNRIKYVLFVGIAVVVAAVAAIAELESLCLWLAGLLKDDEIRKYAGWLFIALMVLIAYAEATPPTGYSSIVLIKSFATRYQDDPSAMMPKMASICEKLRSAGTYDQDICNAGYNASYANATNNQYNSKVCMVSQLSTSELFPGNSSAEQEAASYARSSASFRCNRVADYWIETMEWIKNHLGPDDRTTSWWDYGHWINFFGDRKAVLQNQQSSPNMIGMVAEDYIDGTPQQLASDMNYFNSSYALFDDELIGGLNGQSFGGKYGALNYLSCSHENLTSVQQQPGASECEAEHSPERVLIMTVQNAQTSCTISQSQQLTGTLAYAVNQNGVDTSRPAYCVGTAVLEGGQKIPATYYLNRSDANGNLVLSKGFIRVIDSSQQGAVTAEMVYDNEQVWPGPNGTWVDGMADAKTKFYTSNLYRALFLNNLPGYSLAYTSANGEVKIYRMNDFTGNPTGWVNETAAARSD